MLALFVMAIGKDVNELSTNGWRSGHYCGCRVDWLERPY